MHRRCCLLLLLLFFKSAPHGQHVKPLPQLDLLYHNAEKLYNASNPTTVTDSLALAAYQQVVRFSKQENIYNNILLDSYLKCGILTMVANDQTKALQYFLAAVDVKSAAPAIADSFMFQPCLYAGNIYYTLNNLDSAGFYYSKAENIISNKPDLNEAERLYNKYGVLYYETGDYTKSITYFEKALSIVKNKNPLNAFFIVNYQNNLASAYLKSGDYQKALQLFMALLPYHVADNELFFNIGKTYNSLGNYNEAIFYFKKITGIGHEKMNSLAKEYINLKKYDSAALYLAQAKSFYTNNINRRNEIEWGTTLQYSGDLKAATGKAFEAAEDYQLAINKFYPVFKDTAIATNPTSFLGLQKFYLLFDALLGKAAALEALSVQQHENQWMKLSLKSYLSALALASHIEQTYGSDDAKFFLKKRVTPAAQDAVNVAINLYNETKQQNFLQAAFNIAENNKASVLQSGIQGLQLSGLAGIPADLLAKEKMYKSLIAKLMVQPALLNDSVAALQSQKQLQDHEIALAAVQAKLQAVPRYRQLKSTVQNPNFDSLQKNAVAANECILSYYYTKRTLLCFYIVKGQFDVQQVAIDSSFFENILLLRKALQAPEASGTKTITGLGLSLYKKLVAPVLDKIKNKKRLVVIPCNEISYIPFELLQDDDGNLLLNHFAISYNYAVNFLSAQNDAADNNYKVLAMAPFSEQNAGATMPVLPSSTQEINDLPGKKMYGATATKEQFMRLANQYPVVHLATHAVVNDSSQVASYIAFYGTQNDPGKSRLYAPEIYTLNLKSAKLIILSACETGNGVLVNGEGIISLSRAFSYAGCKSVVTSLWKADDMSTAFITQQLHHYLQQGRDKDEALQQAKIDYLNSDKIEERYKTPAYWAHLILTGNHYALVSSRHQTYKIILFVLLVMATIYIIYKIKKRA